MAAMIFSNLSGNDLSKIRFSAVGGWLRARRAYSYNPRVFDAKKSKARPPF
jgi:hypothetical protein